MNKKLFALLSLLLSSPYLFAAPNNVVSVTPGFYNDTGNSATDFVTIASNNLSGGTISPALGVGQALWGSTDNGATWRNLSAENGQWNACCNGPAVWVEPSSYSWVVPLVPGFSSLQYKVVDGAGTGPVTTQYYQVDNVVPSYTISNVKFSNDDGASSTDLITTGSIQTITGTLSKNLVNPATLSDSLEAIYGSVDGGATWADITSGVSGKNIAWNLVNLKPGVNQIQFKVIDLAGNVSSIFGNNQYTYTTDFPAVSGITFSADSGINTTDKVTKNANQTVSASLSRALRAGEKVFGTVNNGSTWVDITSGVSGTSIVWNATLANGLNSIKFKVQDAGGNSSGDTGLTVYILDTVAPAQTVGGTQFSNDGGESSSDLITSTTSQTITAQLSTILNADAAAGSGERLKISLNGGSTFVDITNKVSGTAVSYNGATLLSGANTIQYRIEDDAGNYSAVSTASYVVDTVAPTSTFVLDIPAADDTGSRNWDNITNKIQLNFQATFSPALAVGESAYLSLDNGVNFVDVTANVAGGTAFLSQQNVAEGSNTAILKIADRAGNSVQQTLNYTVDLTAPAQTITTNSLSADTGISNTDFITNTSAQTINAALSAALVAGEVVDGSVDGGATWESTLGYGVTVTGTNVRYATSKPLVSGANNIVFRVLDLAGNVGAITGTKAYMLDTTASLVRVTNVALSADTGAPGDFVTGVATQTISATLTAPLSSGEYLEGTVNGGAAWTNISNMATGTALSWTGATLISGTNTLNFRIADAAGNLVSNTGTKTYTLDITPPTQTVSNVRISTDSGASTSDLITKTAAQTITATLSAALSAGDKLEGSVDAGATWANITSKVSATAINWDGATLTTGVNQIAFRLSDSLDNKSANTGLTSYSLDTQAPAINFGFAEGVTLAGTAAITAEITENATSNDVEIKAKSVTISGGGEVTPFAATPFTTRVSQTKTNLAFASTRLFPSETAFSIEVVADDIAGNTTTATRTFRIPAEKVALPDLQMPVTNVALYSLDRIGHAIKTDMIIDGNSQPLTDIYPIKIHNKQSSASAIVVKGVSIAPGESKIVDSAYDFAAKFSAIDLPAYTSTEGVTNIEISTNAPGSSIYTQKIVAWKPAVTLQGDAEIEKFTEELNLHFVIDNSACILTSGVTSATGKVFGNSPYCYIELNQKPQFSKITTSNNEVKITGRVSETNPSIAYSIYAVDSNSVKALLQSSTLALTTTAPALDIQPDTSRRDFVRKIEKIDFTVKDNTTTCDIYKQVPISYDPARRVCILTLTQKPAGLDFVDYMETASISGYLQNEGDNTIAYDLSIIADDGQLVKVRSDTITLKAVNPIVPLISLTGAKSHAGKFAISTNEGVFGAYQVTANNLPLMIEVFRDETRLSVEEAGAFGNATEKTKIQTDLSAPARNLWVEETYRITAAYQDMPDINSEFSFTTHRVPSASIVPDIIAPMSALNTESLGIEVRIIDDANSALPYDETVMGAWRVRLANQQDKNTYEYLTEFVETQNGVARFDLDIAGRRTLNIVAVAELVSSVDGYVQKAVSEQQYVKMILGDAIDGALTGQVTGRVPLKAAFLFAASDRALGRSVGDVRFEMSKDGGAFVAVDSESAQLGKLSLNLVEPGVYQVRAITANKNSGVEATTPVATLNAYDIPTVKVVGNATYYVGETSDMSILATTKTGEVIPASNLVVEWSTDGARTFDVKADRLNFSATKVGAVKGAVRVRYTSSPVDQDKRVWAYGRARISFAKPTPVRLTLKSPKKAESGAEAGLIALAKIPNRGINKPIVYKWSLPGGITATTPETSFTPSGENEVENFSVSAYVEGYEEQTKTTISRSITIWDYVFPEFELNIKQTFAVAPSGVTLKAIPLSSTSRLENLSYAWDLPAGAEVVKDSYSAMMLTFAEPGEHTISVRVHDSRGNEQLLTKTISLSQAPALTMSYADTFSNRYNRAPLNVISGIGIKGGHPADKVNTVDLYVNGTKVVTDGGMRLAYTLPAGTHSIKVSATTLMGQTVESTHIIAVAQNQKPACEIIPTKRSLGILLESRCYDNDGSVSKYRWTINGQTIYPAGYSLVLPKSSYPAGTAISASVEAQDDASEFSPPAQWSGTQE